MEMLIDCVLRNTLTICQDTFGKNCTFVSFQREDGNFKWDDGHQSSARFGRIVYRRNNKEEYSDHLVLKVTPSDLFMEKYSMLAFFNEVFFYTRILPFFENFNADFGRLFPKYYNSLLQYNLNVDEAVIVFENLQASGYISSPKKSFLDYAHLSLMLRKLGEFHAHSYRAREADPDGFHALTLCTLETNCTVLRQCLKLAPFLTRSIKPTLEDCRYISQRKNLLDIIDRCDEILRNVYTGGDESKSTHVLCHGDFLGNNLLFKYNEDGRPIDLKIVDLASIRFGSPAIDLALVLYLHTDQATRNEHWDDLIDEYYTAVRDTFPSTKVPSKVSILAEFKTSALVAYFIASYYLAYLVVSDNDELPTRADILPEKYRNAPRSSIPAEFLREVYAKLGGEKTTRALIEILKDIIDRGYSQVSLEKANGIVNGLH